MFFFFLPQKQTARLLKKHSATSFMLVLVLTDIVHVVE